MTIRFAFLRMADALSPYRFDASRNASNFSFP